MGFSRALDFYISYRFIRELTKSWTQMEAFKLGIIDENGNILKKDRDLKTPAEKDAYTPFNRIVWNLKKMMEKMGGKSKIISYSAAAWMLKENEDWIARELEEDDAGGPTNVASGIEKKDQPLFLVRRKKLKRERKKKTSGSTLKEQKFSIINLNNMILDIDPNIRENSLLEATKKPFKRRRKVIRKGKARYKIFCPAGKQVKQGRCVVKTSKDKMRFKKANRLRKRTMAGKSKAKILRKRTKSNRRRSAMGLK